MTLHGYSFIFIFEVSFAVTSNGCILLTFEVRIGGNVVRLRLLFIFEVSLAAVSSQHLHF